jgi:hypothetical protein
MRDTRRLLSAVHRFLASAPLREPAAHETFVATGKSSRKVDAAYRLSSPAGATSSRSDGNAPDGYTPQHAQEFLDLQLEKDNSESRSVRLVCAGCCCSSAAAL